MLPPFCCTPKADHVEQRRHHQQRKLAMLTFWRDNAERQLSALSAAITTLQQQIDRDSQPQG